MEGAGTAACPIMKAVLLPADGRGGDRKLGRVQAAVASGDGGGWPTRC